MELVEFGAVAASAGFGLGTDSGDHADAIRKLFESGATIVNVHAGQQDQRRAIEFHGSQVLPRLDRS